MPEPGAVANENIRRTVFLGLLDHKPRWGLSARGWLAFSAGTVVAGLLFLFYIHPFLAVTQRADTQALVVEGWISQVEIAEATPIVFTFPDGARDVEAFVVDPRSGELLLISKQSDGHSQVLTASAAMLSAGGGELSLAGRLDFGKPPLPGNPMPTSASISPDGSRILVRTYSSVFAFERKPEESVAAALQRPPRSLSPPPEHQGEAVTFADQGSAFVTISEGVRPQIFCGSW